MTTTRALVVSCLLLVHAAGCLEGEGGRAAGSACARESDCAEGLRCVYGRCRPLCTFDRDCPGGACVPSPEDPTLRVCTFDEEPCPPGLVPAPDGECREECGGDEDCQGPRRCVDGVCMEAEVCNGEDDDLDGLVDEEEAGGLCPEGGWCEGGVCAGPPELPWIHLVASEGSDYGDAAAVDVVGGVLLGGLLGGSAELGEEPCAGEGGSDGFLLRLWPDGRERWGKCLGGPGVDFVTSVAFRPDGTVLVAGCWSDGVDFGDGPRAVDATLGSFVLAYGPEGELLWSQPLGRGERCEAHVVARDDGVAVVAGAFDLSLDVGGESLPSAGGIDGFVVAFDAQGAHLWHHQLGGPGTDSVMAVATGPAGVAAATGSCQSAIDLAGIEGDCEGPGLNSVFLLALDDRGARAWSRVMQGEHLPTVRGLAYDGEGSLLVAGQLTRTLDLGAAEPVATGADTALGFVACYGPAEAYQWHRLLESSANSMASAIAASGTGQILVGGSFAGWVDVGTGRLPATAAPDVVVAGLRRGGAADWAEPWTGSGSDVVGAVASNAAGTLVVAGSYSGGLDLGFAALPGRDSSAVYLVAMRR